ncbi:MAG: hypothetical protein AAF718_06055 [Pseudomonadota bacterium]
MRASILLPAIAMLAACGGQQNTTETYTCANGPFLSVAYSDEGALIVFPTGRREILEPTETPELYAKPGVVWDARPFRTARLTDGERSLQCDQMEG